MRTFIRTAPKTGGFTNSVYMRNCGVISALRDFRSIGFQNSHSPKILQGDFIYVRKRKTLPASAAQR